MTDGEPETVVSASLQKIKSIKNPIKLLLFFIKYESSDSFVSHFDGHLAYLKTLDFYFKQQLNGEKWDGELRHLFVFAWELRCFRVYSYGQRQRWRLPVPNFMRSDEEELAFEVMLHWAEHTRGVTTQFGGPRHTCRVWEDIHPSLSSRSRSTLSTLSKIV